MRNYLILFVLIIVGCNDRNYPGKKFSPIQYSEIKSAEIKKELYDSFSVELDSEQVMQTVNLINSSTKTEFLKAGPRFWLFVKLKNDSIIKYKITDTKIGEYDSYKEMNDKDFFKAIYNGNMKRRSQITE